MEHSTSDNARVDLVVEGMSCGHCEKAVRRVLEGLAGVADVTVDLAGGRASADLDPASVSPEAVAAAVTAAGYPARVEG